MSDDEKQADKTQGYLSHRTFEELDRIPAEIFEAIEVLNMSGDTKKEVMLRQRRVIEMFLNQIDQSTATTPRWTIYDGLAIEAWKAKQLPPKPKRGRPGASRVALFVRAMEKIFVREDYNDLRAANRSAKAGEALSRVAEKNQMDVEQVNNIIRMSKKDITSPPTTPEEPEIVQMWFEWLAGRRKKNFPDK